MQSMTAFSRHQQQANQGTIIWEIRSVNHRYLDVAWRLPDAFRVLEPQLREALKDKIQRGKLECALKIIHSGGELNHFTVNHLKVAALLQAAKVLELEYALENDLSIGKLISLPELLVSVNGDDSALFPEVMSVFSQAVDQMLQLRHTEGKAIVLMMNTRLEGLSALIADASAQAVQINQQLQSKLCNKLEELKITVDEQRISQEIALMLNRMDVSEELDRLAAHADQIKSILRQDGAVGRKLDFLMQELNREANTLSSKTDDLVLTRTAVDMKVLIEQMREQIQNIE